MSHYSCCQFKFAFDVSVESPLAWNEYFGWEDAYDMLHFFLKDKLQSDTLSFRGTDSSGAKMTIIFETECEPEQFQNDYNLAVKLLEDLSQNPPYNPDGHIFNNMLEYLEEEGITIFEDEPDLNVFLAYNKANFGFKTYQEYISNSVLERLKKDNVQIIKKIPDDILSSVYNHLNIGNQNYRDILSDFIQS